MKNDKNPVYKSVEDIVLDEDKNLRNPDYIVKIFKKQIRKGNNIKYNPESDSKLLDKIPFSFKQISNLNEYMKASSKKYEETQNEEDVKNFDNLRDYFHHRKASENPNKKIIY